MEVGIHLLDLARVLTQDEIHSVSADIDPPGGPKDPEHRAHSKLITSRGLPCYLTISPVSQGRVTRAEIIGAEGQALADWTTGIVSRASRGNETPTTPVPPVSRWLRGFETFVRRFEPEVRCPLPQKRSDEQENLPMRVTEPHKTGNQFS